MPESVDRNVDDGKLTRGDFYTTRDLTSDYFQVVREKSRPVWCRIQWFLITMGFLGVTAYMVFNLLKNYLKFESYDSVSVQWVSSLALPAITICNVNPMNYNRLKANYKSDILAEFLEMSADIAKYSGEDLSYFTSDEAVEIMKSIDAEFSDGEADVFRDNNYEMEDLLVGMKIDHPVFKLAGKWMDENQISTTYHQLGHCMEINNNESMVQTVGGYRGGLTIDLDVKSDTYLPTTPQVGFMVYLRAFNETVVLDKDGILVTPGSENFISLEKHKVERLQPKYGTCKNESSMFKLGTVETTRECLQSVWLNISAEYCGCVPWFLIDKLEELERKEQIEKWISISLDEDEVFNWTAYADGEVAEDDYMCGYSTYSLCEAYVMDKFNNATWLASSTFKTVCNEPCKYYKYESSLDYSDFPVSEEHFNTMMGDFSKNYTYVSKNFLRVHIFYEDLKLTTITQSASYEIFNFIAELGGTVDLMIGFSFFTCFQLLEIFIAYLLFRCCRRGPPPPGPRDSGRGPPPPPGGRRPKRGDIELPRSDNGIMRSPTGFLGFKF